MAMSTTVMKRPSPELDWARAGALGADPRRRGAPFTGEVRRIQPCSKPSLAGSGTGAPRSVSVRPAPALEAADAREGEADLVGEREQGRSTAACRGEQQLVIVAGGRRVEPRLAAARRDRPRTTAATRARSRARSRWPRPSARRRCSRPSETSIIAETSGASRSPASSRGRGRAVALDQSGAAVELAA